MAARLPGEAERQLAYRASASQRGLPEPVAGPAVEAVFGALDIRVPFAELCDIEEASDPERLAYPGRDDGACAPFAVRPLP